MVSRSKIESDAWAIVRGAVIGWAIIGRWRWVVVIRWRLRRGTIHIEINPRRNLVFSGKGLAGAKQPRLDKLICGDRQRLHDVIKRSKIVKSAVGVAEDFNVQGCFAHI